jgi:hypothetical protein
MMIPLDLPPSPALPSSLPPLRFGIDPIAAAQQELRGAVVELRAGGKAWPGSAWVDSTYGGCVRALHLAFGRAPLDEMASAIASVWGPAPFVSKSRVGWLDASSSFRASLRKDGGEVSLAFSPVQPLAQWFAVLEAALRGEPTLPRLGMTRAELAAAFSAPVLNGQAVYCAAPPTVFGDTEVVATVDIGGDDRVARVFWNASAGALDGKKAIERAVVDFWRARGVTLAPKRFAHAQVVDGVEVQCGCSVSATSGSLTASLRAV